MSSEIMIASTTLPEFRLTDEVAQLRDAALDSAALVGRVQSDLEDQSAAAALTQISTLRRAIERARKEAKEPALKYGRELDSVCNRLTDELKPEEMRISRLMGDWAALKRQRRAAEEAAARAELAARERERAAELARAKSLEEVEDVQERFNQESRDIQDRHAVAVPASAPKGQVVKEDWDVTVTDIWMLARAHPACVDIKPRLSEIKSLLNAGLEVKGVTATKTTSVQIRASKPIDI